MTRRGGFTLVEILTSIAILTVLLGLTTVLVGPGTAKAKTQPKCSSNLHQVAVGYQLYLSDNDDQFPTRAPLHEDHAPYAYLNLREVMRCPLTGVEYWDNFGWMLAWMKREPRFTTLWNGDPIPPPDPYRDVLYRCLDHGFHGYDRGIIPGRWDGCSPGRVLGVRLSGTVAQVPPNSCWEFATIPSFISPSCPDRPIGSGCDRPFDGQ